MRHLPLILLLLPLPALADSAQIGDLNFPRITIEALRDGKLIYTDRANHPATADLNKVTTLDLDEYPLITQAEKLVAQNQPKQAIPLYTATLAKMNDKALQPLIKARTLRALDQSGDFATALEYFWDLYAASPTAGTFSLRPQKFPATGSKMLTDTANYLAAKLSDPHLKTPESARLLQGYLLEIYQQNKDPLATALARQLSTNTDEPPPLQPAATQPILPAPHQKEIETALSTGHFQEALQWAQSDLAGATGPTAIQLFTFKAQALAGLKNPAAAAAAYLRIAAYYPDNELAASEALFQAAELLESLNQPEAAKRLYRELIEKFPQTPHFQAASQKAK